MIIVDTNTASEPSKPKPDARVLAWFHAQSFTSLYITSVNLAEIYAGIERLPSGRRKNALRVGMDKLIGDLFGSRILSFDLAAAKAYSQLIALTSARGVTLTFADAQIASIALVHGFAVATRDTTPFLAAGVKVINPFEY